MHYLYHYQLQYQPASTESTESTEPIALTTTTTTATAAKLQQLPYCNTIISCNSHQRINISYKYNEHNDDNND
ncbi:unnamed protein product [Rhizophagus irregularis]|nr:unnamed protein product [Rhizophagus irregularis]